MGATNVLRPPVIPQLCEAICFSFSREGFNRQFGINTEVFGVSISYVPGQTAEEMSLPANDGGASSRWLAIGLPAIWQTLSQNSLVPEERP